MVVPDPNQISARMQAVGDGHALHVVEWGAPMSDEVWLFVHGGPGSGCRSSSRRFFDPTRHRVIFHDQRGAGMSTPNGSLVSNDTEHLVADIIKVLDASGLESCNLAGGSWGSTLALAFALAHPDRVRRMVLWGIFTARDSERDFFDLGQFAPFFPDHWARYVATVPDAHAVNPTAYHIGRILDGDDEVARRSSALAYGQLEEALAHLDLVDVPSEDDADMSGVAIECHYLRNSCFLPEGALLKRAHELTTPVDIVQGRFDMVCPPVTAYELDRRLPNSTMHWTVAGHSGGDPGNYEAIRALIWRSPDL